MYAAMATTGAGTIEGGCGHRAEQPKGLLFETALASLARQSTRLGLVGAAPAYRLTRCPERKLPASVLGVGQTGFFRDPYLTAILCDRVLPRLIAQRRSTRRLRIWCAGVSTGQEAYSVSMLLGEYFPELTGWDISIVGTDLSQAAVEFAAAGRYSHWEVRSSLEAPMLRRYMEQRGDAWYVSPSIASQCSFRQSDLCGDEGIGGSFDLILCRNVVLSIAGEERAAAFHTLRRHIESDGFLLMGSAEQAEDWTDLFQGDAVSEGCVYRPAVAA